ncbi:MAG: 30S ribosomal protein S5 [Candidatus Falkowbacteria bacterium]|nr:30S ribosomal protein S5 [Candidatus Falkowbacteria bacterium]
MSDENKNQATQNKPATQPATGGDKRRNTGGARGPRRNNDREKPRDEFEQRILDVARVTRVMAGGKRMNFRTCVAIGDRKGKIGVGVGKGADVTMAVNKAVNRAKRDMITVTMVNETIPHEVLGHIGASRIIFKPAKKGKGIIAGGVARVILELAGVNNVTSKTLGGNNKLNNARCTIKALSALRTKNVPVVEKKTETVVVAEKE